MRRRKSAVERHRTYRFPRVAIALARNAKTGQTSLQLDNSSTGGAFESLSDAHDQAKEAKSQEGPREGSPASEKTEEANREDSQCRHPERTSLLSALKLRFGHCAVVMDQVLAAFDILLHCLSLSQSRHAVRRLHVPGRS